MAAPDSEIARFAAAMGLTTAQAEATIRSLANLARATDTTTNAQNVQTQSISNLTATQQRYVSTINGAIGIAGNLNSTLLSMADSMAASNSVFSQIKPALNFLSTTASTVGKFIPNVMTTIGTGLGAFFGGPGGAAVGNKLGELVGGVIGGAFGTLNEGAKAVAELYLDQGEKVMNAFNMLSSTGVTFGASLQNMSRVVNSTGVPLEMLAKIAQQNAENLAVLGGGVSGALERVAKAARNDLGPQLVTLYGGFANLGDELAEYLAMQQRIGVQENLLSSENIEGTRNYLYVLKNISDLTGKNAKQLKNEIEQRNRNVAAQNFMNSLDEKGRTQYLAMMAQVPKGMEGVMQDIIMAAARGQEAVSTDYLRISTTMPGIAQAMTRMASGLGKSNEEFVKIMDESGKSLVKSGQTYSKEYDPLFFLKEQGRLSSGIIETANTILTDINSNAGRLQKLGETLGKLLEETKNLKDKPTDFAESVASVADAQAKLGVSLNNLMTGTKDVVGKFSDFAQVAGKLVSTTQGYVDGLDSIVQRILGYKKDLNRPTQNLNPLSEEDFRAAQENPLLHAQMVAYKELELAQTRIQVLENKLLTSGDLSRDESKELETQRARLETTERRLQEIQKRIQNSQNETTNLSGNTSGSSPSNNAQSSMSPTISNSPVDDSKSYAMFERAIREQTIVLSNLAESVTSQGGQIKRAVDRMTA